MLVQEEGGEEDGAKVHSERREGSAGEADSEKVLLMM